MAHFFITLRPPHHLLLHRPTTLWFDCEYDRELPKSFSEIAPSCLSKFAFAWIINLSQEWRRRRQDFFFLCFPRICATGVIGIILLHNTRVFSGIWVFASCSRGHSLSPADFRECLQCSQQKSLLFFPPWLLIKENAVVSFFPAKKKINSVVLVVYSSCFTKGTHEKRKKVLQPGAETFYFVSNECK